MLYYESHFLTSTCSGIVLAQLLLVATDDFCAKRTFRRFFELHLTTVKENESASA